MLQPDPARRRRPHRFHRTGRALPAQLPSTPGLPCGRLRPDAVNRTAVQSVAGRAMAADIECIVLGGGVIGLAVARRLALAGHAVLLGEPDTAICPGPSPRNSAVIP